MLVSETVSDADIARRRTAITRLSTLAKQADDNRKKVIAMNTSLTNLLDAWKKPGVPPAPPAPPLAPPWPLLLPAAPPAPP